MWGVWGGGGVGSKGRGKGSTGERLENQSKVIEIHKLYYVSLTTSVNIKRRVVKNTH